MEIEGEDGEAEDDRSLREGSKGKDEGEDGTHLPPGESYYLLMERAQTTLLDEILYRRQRRQAYSKDELFDCWKSVVSVLAYCSCCGIAHSDIKPSNLLLVRDETKPGNV